MLYSSPLTYGTYTVLILCLASFLVGVSSARAWTNATTKGLLYTTVLLLVQILAIIAAAAYHYFMPPHALLLTIVGAAVIAFGRWRAKERFRSLGVLPTGEPHLRRD